MSRFLILAFIFALPYNNFPYGIGGTLTPLALVPIFLIYIYSFFTFFKKGSTIINKYIFIFGVIFLIFFLLTVINDIRFWDYFLQSKNTSPIFRTVQFAIYIFISLGSFYAGYISLKVFKSVNIVFKYFVLAFIPSIAFGIMEILTNNHQILNLLRKFFANTQFPDGYYRIYLLTTEPSWAAFDLTTFFIPISFYLYLHKKNVIYAILTLIGVILLIFTKSLLGFLTFLTSLFIVVIVFFKQLLIKRQYILSIIVVFLILFIGTIAYKDIYLDRLQKFFLGIDQSGLTRIVSYSVSIKTFQEHPFIGVGFRNTGYFYRDIIYNNYPELLRIDLISDWTEFSSRRFPDVKSTILEIISSAGILGIFLLSIIIYLIYSKLSKIKVRTLKITFTYIFISLFIGSFSINLIGYPTFWFFMGILFNKNCGEIK